MDDSVFAVTDIRQSLEDILQPSTPQTRHNTDPDVEDVEMVDADDIEHQPVPKQRPDPKPQVEPIPVNKLVIRNKTLRSDSESSPNSLAIGLNGPVSASSPTNTSNVSLDRSNSNTIGYSSVDPHLKQVNYALAVNWYLQLAFNCLLWGFVGYSIYYVGYIFRLDVEGRRQAHRTNMAIEIASCLKNYVTNKCMPDQRAPALEEECIRWEKCLNIDPDTHIGTLKLVAETVLDIVSVFFVPLQNLSYIAYGTIFSALLAFSLLLTK